MTTETNRILRRAVRTALLTSGAFGASLAHSSLAQAQAAPANAAPEAAPLEEVVVTGSRIAAPNLDAISPVTAVSAEELKSTGLTRVEDLLNSLPQVVADQGSGLSMGSNGTATINLRGLGTQRTLVLVNGRRLQGGDPGAAQGSTPAFATAADINQIPVSLIERVDVLTGGASATYGADAVAGVVNFVMNDHFEGVRLDANAGIYNHSNHEGWIGPLLAAQKNPVPTGTNWDGENKDIALVMGHAFADGAGHFEGYLGYRRNSPLTADHRDHAACVLTDGYPTGSPFSCAGSSNTAPAVFQVGAKSYQVKPDGTLGARYNSYNFAATHYLQRIDERYTAGFFGKLKFNDHVEAYTEFMFMNDNTRGNYAPAGSFKGSGKAVDAETGLPDGNLSINCGPLGGAFGNSGMNPYLTQSEFNILCASPVAYTNHQNGTATTGGVKYFPYQVSANGDVQVLVGRRNMEGGPREDNYEHTAYRGVFGGRGEIVEDWNYDIYGIFAKTISSDFHNNDTSTERMQNALLAIPTATGPACRGGQAGCIPWNIFDPTKGSPNAAQLAYFSVPGVFNAEEDQHIVSGYVTGDLTKSGLKTPWADDGLKVVFGTEYRREHLVSEPDAEYQSGDLAGIGSPTPPVDAADHVWEAFTEERMPIVRNAPFIKTLDLEAGYRYSSYSIGFDTNTYKIGLEWAPVSDVRVRASYNRAVRAPNLQELYQPVHVQLDTGTDLCAQGTKLTQAQCALLGLDPATYAAGGAAKSPAAQYNGKVGGNPNVNPEVGKTTDVGLVITPSFLPNFNATIDYTDIKITNLITSNGPNLIETNCVNTGLPIWCSNIHRDGAGTLWASPSAYTVDPLLNTGGLEYKGIDIGLSYRFDMGNLGKLRTRFDGTYLKDLLYTPGYAGAYDCAGKFGPSCSPATPTWRHRMTLDWDTPLTGLSTGLTWRFFGETNNTFLDPTNPDYTKGLLASALPDARIPTISYLDLRASYTWNKVTLRVGVNNVLDKDPPTIDTLDSGGNTIYAESNTFPSMYDTAGRYLFVNLTVDL